MLDYLYEIKNNRALEKHPLKKDDLSNLLNNEKEIGNYFKRKNMLSMEMESVHIKVNEKNDKKGIFSFFRKK